MAELTVKELLQILVKGDGDNTPDVANDTKYLNPVAVYILTKSGQDIKYKNGELVEKSVLDEMVLDFTRTRSLTEEKAFEKIKFIIGKQPMLSVFGNTYLSEMVEPIDGRAATRKNLKSNELAGEAVTTDRGVIKTFGINYSLRPVSYEADLPLTAVINNLYNPNFVSEYLGDVELALANDIFLLLMLGVGGNYASTKEFFDLNAGMLYILETMNGKNTNSYGQVTVVGESGKYVTPYRLDAVAATGAGYTGANLMTLMANMHKTLPLNYRRNPNNKWIMSKEDADLYAQSRSALGNGSANVVREEWLTNGGVPRFMGYEILVIDDLPSINEYHEYDTDLPGAIIFGDPKNVRLAFSKKRLDRYEEFKPRGSLGAVYEYTWTLYCDVQVVAAESFVVAYKGAKAVTPVAVASTNLSGNVGEASGTAPAYVQAGATKVKVFCDSQNVVMVLSLGDQSADVTLADGLASHQDAAIIPNGHEITFGASPQYVKAYHKNGLLTASTQATFTQS